MPRPRFASTIALALALALACGGAAETPEPVAAAKEAETPTPTPAPEPELEPTPDPDADAEPDREPEPPPEAAEDEPPPATAAPPPDLGAPAENPGNDSGTLEIATATKSGDTLSPTWLEAGELPGKARFFSPYTALAFAGGKFHAPDTNGSWAPIADAGKKWGPARKITPFAHAFSMGYSTLAQGRWPNDLWYFEQEDEERGAPPFYAHHWTGEKWEVSTQPKLRGQAADIALEVEFTVRAFWSPRGGILYALTNNEDESTRFARAGSDLKPPRKLEVPAPEGVLETRGGTLFVLAGDSVIRTCPNRAKTCGARTEVQIPEHKDGGPVFGSTHVFKAAVARQLYSMSAVVDINNDEMLLHYGKGGWALEQGPSEQKSFSIAPGVFGGLWIATGSKLWHREKNGGWSTVTLPEGAPKRARWYVALHDDRVVALASTRAGSKLYTTAPNPRA